ncbi:hypothetical protein B1219_01705 [Pseudomonas ogarae]|nr:hypothetical protein B1219_01705 [Pseudomonas ogarae]OPG79074.1 hypothetical protein B1218_12310 [Pseudomonas ogarae]
MRCSGLSQVRQRTCGSGLARENGVSGTMMLTDTPLSRASPLPQVLYWCVNPCPWSGSCSARHSFPNAR